MRSIRTLAIPLLLLVVVANLMAACGASQRQKAITTTFAVLKAADASWGQYDQDHRTNIVAKATSHEQGQALLAEWDSTADVIEKGIQTAYKACTAAAVANDDPSLAGMLQAWLIVQKQLTKLGVLR